MKREHIFAVVCCVLIILGSSLIYVSDWSPLKNWNSKEIHVEAEVPQVTPRETPPQQEILSSAPSTSDPTPPVVATTTLPKPIPILIGTTTTKTKPDKQSTKVEPTSTAVASTATPVIQPSPQPMPAPTPTPVIPTLKNDLTWGVFTGSNQKAVSDFEARVDTNPDYLAYFVHWGNDNGKLPTWLKSAAGNKDRTLVIFWEASDHLVGGTVQPEYAYRTILDGDHDEYIADFANQLKTYNAPVILIPFSELNGNWTPWSGTTNGNTPNEAVLAYRYIHDFFDDVSNVKFGLALNAASVPDTPENAHEMYYPGDAYVDYIGLDGFNMGDPWLSFDEIFAPGLKAISVYRKPMFIFSFASASGGGKTEWLDDAFLQMSAYPGLTGFIYFNQNKERNWLLWSDNDTLESFTNFVEKL